ncbi:MAG TPA: glycoside hydrolase family 2 TIM barrel-domain containing protein [Rhodanobacteraceae bacterium]|nr:glycoside hydrolase family 2 TIM barrel-domain containing protein [Rhodanobacteraceae bacterium]
MLTAMQHVCRTAAALAVLSASAAYAANAFAPVQVGQGPGHVTQIGHWEIQTSAKAQQSGAEISTDGFQTKDWYPVSGRATVMAGLMENGRYKDVFHSDNLRTVARHHFVVPWWYRTEFDLGHSTTGLHTFVRTNGMIAGADLWLNGHEIADHSEIRGAYPVHVIDVTRWVHPGLNTLALRVYPADAERDFTMGWVDWNPPPPDHNMGPWRGVDIVQTGPVALRYPQVTSKLSLPDLQHAALTVKVEVSNLDAASREATVTGEVAGVSLRRVVQLAAGQTTTVTFSPRTDPGLDVSHPKIWWPAQMGAHPLYDLKLAVHVEGALSDRAATAFGIRSVTSTLTRQGYRQFFINGKPVLIRGGGWAPDMFLRDDPRRMAAEFSYIRNMGLNAIRSEGKLEDQQFYDLADRYGIMILPGWECCDKWEAAARTGGEPWSAADQKVAGESMASEARLLRNHPSVIAFLIGSDNAPPPAVASMYVEILQAEDWPDPIVSAASGQGTTAAGPSGLKMSGPYAWVPPSYWYADKLGGAFGFDSEVSAGADIPLLEDVQRMLSPLDSEALWKYPNVRQYHATTAWSPFSRLERFDTALAKRYGPPKSLEDYVEKAQLANYDNVRAQFEAFNAHMDSGNPSSGVIYWMLDNAWPSLHWHLFDYYLNPAGAFFGAKKANEPVHIQYSYRSASIVLVNHTLIDEKGLQARIRIRNLDGSVRYDKLLKGIDLPADHTVHLMVLPKLADLSGTYFVELDLDAADGHSISRNVYWLPTQTDKLDWKNANWYMTPVSRYADLTALQSLPAATTQVHASTRREGDDDVTTITLTVPRTSQAVALFQHLSIRQSAHGAPVLPILWSDNDVTLWPGESLTLTARYKAEGVTNPIVELSGLNTAIQDVSAMSR